MGLGININNLFPSQSGIIFVFLAKAMVKLFIKLTMKRILISLSLFISIFFLGCSHDETTVQIVRTPTFTFNFNSDSSWKADTYSFAPISKVVVYPQDPSQNGQLFNRFTLQGSGRDNLGNTYQLIITFDAANVNQLVGIYSPVYTTQSGLSQVQLFNLTNTTNLAAYNLCQDNMNNAVLKIQKQNLNETLITGTFQMTLCNSRDSTQKINITDGILKDIKY